ncbi:hypothetical protein DFJ74DRAFT_726228 [Hyaloraphidium curvatum]|nr:hypothetical protein DFJ74DRAFT_714814 [Hyaloraphidium curvatum]KAI9033056.1 hypothetical protein DFJ74DRAFT_726228 [Hyaloraphidium curvatum]
MLSPRLSCAACGAGVAAAWAACGRCGAAAVGAARAPEGTPRDPLAFFRALEESAARWAGGAPFPAATGRRAAGDALSLAGFALPSPVAGPPDAPHLTAEARFLFLKAFSDRVPRGAAAPVHPRAFRACFVRGPDSPDPDGWYFRAATDPLYVDTMCWIGARMVRSGAHPGLFLGRYSHAHDLNGTVRALQAVVQRGLRDRLADFWADVADGIRSSAAVTGERLRTPANYALMRSLIVCAAFCFLPMGQVVTARATFALVASMWVHTGIEGTGPARAASMTVDDWLCREHWVRTFWVTATFELTLAAGSQTRPAFDVVEYPNVPLPASDEAFHSVMPSGAGGPDPTPVARLLAQAPSFRVREVFAWMDPSLAPPFPAGARSMVLLRLIGDVERSMTTFTAAIDSYLLVQVHAFWKWASEDAALLPLEVLVGEHLLSAGAGSSSPSLRLRAAGISETEAAYILSHPHLRAAVSRLAFLRSALDALESALPPRIRNSEDPLSAPQLASFDAVQRHKLLAHIASVRLAGMLLSSPGPPDQLAQDAPPGTLAAWSALPAFVDASQRAVLVARTMRVLLARFGPRDHASNLQLPVICSAASHAGAFHALLLRRGGDRTGEARDGLAACAGMLRASGRKDAAEAAGVLERLAAGGIVGGDEREVVLMTREAAGEDEEGEG